MASGPAACTRSASSATAAGRPTIDLALGASSGAAVHGAIDIWDGFDGNGNTPLKQAMAAGVGTMTLAAGPMSPGVDRPPCLHPPVRRAAEPGPGLASRQPGISPPTSGLPTRHLAIARRTGPVASRTLGLMQALSNPAANFGHVMDAASLPNLFAAMTESLIYGDIQVSSTASPGWPGRSRDGGDVHLHRVEQQRGHPADRSRRWRSGLRHRERPDDDRRQRRRVPVLRRTRGPSPAPPRSRRPRPARPARPAPSSAAGPTDACAAPDAPQPTPYPHPDPEPEPTPTPRRPRPQARPPARHRRPPRRRRRDATPPPPERGHSAVALAERTAR